MFYIVSKCLVPASCQNRISLPFYSSHPSAFLHFVSLFLKGAVNGMMGWWAALRGFCRAAEAPLATHHSPAAIHLHKRCADWEPIGRLSVLDLQGALTVALNAQRKVLI